MERKMIVAALAHAYGKIYEEYQTLSELAKELLHDGEDGAYQSIARRAQGKSHTLDGIRMAAAALGIRLEEITQKEAQL